MYDVLFMAQLVSMCTGKSCDVNDYRQLKGACASPTQLFSWVARDCISVMTAAIFLKQALY